MKKKFLLILAVAAAFFLYPRPPRAPRPAVAPLAVAPRPAPAHVVVARVPASSRTAPSQSLAHFEARLERTAACLDGDCDYPRDDEHSYQYAVGQTLKTELAHTREWVVRTHLQSPAVIHLAVRYLKIGDGHVQAEALALLATQPPSADALQAVINDVIGGYDAQLIAAGLAELARYGAENDRVRIGHALADAMMTGAPNVAKEVSRGIAPFVTDGTLAVFQEAAAEIPAGSLVRANLEKVLRAGRK